MKRALCGSRTFDSAYRTTVADALLACAARRQERMTVTTSGPDANKGHSLPGNFRGFLRSFALPMSGGGLCLLAAYVARYSTSLESVGHTGIARRLHPDGTMLAVWGGVLLLVLVGLFFVVGFVRCGVTRNVQLLAGGGTPSGLILEMILTLVSAGLLMALAYPTLPSLFRLAGVCRSGGVAGTAGVGSACGRYPMLCVRGRAVAEQQATALSSALASGQ